MNATKLAGFTDCYEGKTLKIVELTRLSICFLFVNHLISKVLQTNLLSAILLLNSVIRVFNVKMEVKKEVKEELSASQLNNVKLHLEQITPVLCSLFDLKYLSEINTVAEDEVDKLDEILNTYCAVLITLSTVAEKDDWIEIICKQVSYSVNPIPIDPLLVSFRPLCSTFPIGIIPFFS